jgi:hypothetical protein
MQRTTRKNRIMNLAGAVVAPSFVVGCASVPLRTEKSTSGIRAAEEVGAREVPQAALHLQLAKEELQKAKSLAAQGEDDRAKSKLMRAEVDAELAVMLSREDTEKAEAEAAVARVKELRQDNDQPTP